MKHKEKYFKLMLTNYKNNFSQTELFLDYKTKFINENNKFLIKLRIF